MKRLEAEEGQRIDLNKNSRKIASRGGQNKGGVKRRVYGKEKQ